MTQPVILVVDSTMIDLIADAERLPGAGETVVGSGFRMGFGGKGANQAVAAARFGARAALVNIVGDDGYGSDYLENLAAQGVDTTFVRRVPGSSGVAPIGVGAADLGCRFAADSVTRPGTQASFADHAGAAAMLAVVPG